MGQLQSKYAMSAAEVAQAMGNITESGVNKLEASALAKLRRNGNLRRVYLESIGFDRRSNNVGSLFRDEYEE